MATDLDAIRARHHSTEGVFGGELPYEWTCAWCDQPWGEHGCDTAIVLAALDRHAAAYVLYREKYDAAIQPDPRLDALLAALERLAERDPLSTWDMWRNYSALQDALRDALAAFEEKV